MRVGCRIRHAYHTKKATGEGTPTHPPRKEVDGVGQEGASTAEALPRSPPPPPLSASRETRSAKCGIGSVEYGSS
jgi:hypothetical protein